MNRTVCQLIIGCTLFVPSLIALATPPQSQISDDVVAASAVIDRRYSRDITPMPAEGTTLRVLLGRTLLLRSPDPLKRVSITDPAVATAVTVSPNEVMLHGLSLGAVTLILWDEQGRSRSFELRVELEIESLRQTIQRLFPGEDIRASVSGKSVVLAGRASAKEIADRAVALAQTQAPSVVNLLTLQVQAPEAATVMLQVRFAEVDRTALQELGVNIFSTGAANTFGSATTGQFGQLGTNSGAVPANVSRGSDPPLSNLTSGGIGNTLKGTPSVFGLSDLLNVFLFRPDLNLGLTLRALEQRSLLQILAEPNMLAKSGSEASFLAGGEFPFPVVQGVGGLQSVTILFKEFGVRLKFTPNVQSDGMIRLKVAPEVSSLDFSNAVTVSGFMIPALSTRRAETEVELRDGQSFAIAGLIDNRTREIASKVPVLADIPIIGNFFKSRALRRDNSELLVMVTPRLVQPVEASQAPAGPEFPKPFMDKQRFDRGKFDGNAGEAPRATRP